MYDSEQMGAIAQQFRACVSEIANVWKGDWVSYAGNISIILTTALKTQLLLNEEQNWSTILIFQAMVLSPNNPSTYSAIGYCQVLIGNCKQAAELFHKALALKRDDTFSTTMLNYVLEQLVDEYQDPVEPDDSLVPKSKSGGKDKSDKLFIPCYTKYLLMLIVTVFEFDYLIQNSPGYKSNQIPVAALIPLDDISCEDAFKTPNSGRDDTNDSSKLSYEMEISDPSSQALDGSSSKI